MNSKFSKENNTEILAYKIEMAEYNNAGPDDLIDILIDTQKDMIEIMQKLREQVETLEQRIEILEHHHQLR